MTRRLNKCLCAAPAVIAIGLLGVMALKEEIPESPDSKKGHKASSGAARALRSEGSWLQGLSGASPSERWREITVAEGPASERIAAEFLAHWIFRDPLAGLEAFQAYTDWNPESASAFSLGMGEAASDLRWSDLLQMAEERLDNRAFLLFSAAAAVGLAEIDPVHALELCRQVADTHDTQIISAQLNARQQVVAKIAAQDLPLAVSWAEEHASEEISVWSGLCNAVATNGLTAYTDAEMLGLLSKIPVTSSLVEKLLTGELEAGGRRLNAQRLLAAMDVGEMEVDGKIKAEVFSEISRRFPEMLDAEYLAGKDEQVIYSVGRGRAYGNLKETISWAANLDADDRREAALRGVVHELMTRNTYTSSKMLSELDVRPETFRMIVAAMVEWLDERGFAQEAEQWRGAL